MNRAETSGELVIWIYRFMMIAAITLAFVIIVGNKYTENFDVRHAEATILSERAAKCISDIQPLESCIGGDKFNYYIFSNITSLKTNLSRHIEIGNSDLKVRCELLLHGTKFQKAPECSQFSYIILEGNETMILKLNIGIGKYAQNLQ